RRHTRFSRDWSSDVCSSDLDLVDRDVLTVAAPARGRVADHREEVGAEGARRTAAAAHGLEDLRVRLLHEVVGVDAARDAARGGRSEERRVGKEGRAWAVALR